MVSWGDCDRGAAVVWVGSVGGKFLRPLFVVLFICMGITASLELGPGRWMGEVMGKVMSFAGANAGILVLVYGNFLMAVVGIITASAMGWIVDIYGHDQLPFEETRICIAQGIEVLPQIKETGGEEEIRGIDEAIIVINEVNEYISANNELPKVKTAKSLRNIASYAGESETGRVAAALIGPADEYGGPYSFRWVAALSVVIIVVFGFLFMNDRSKGGYKAVKIGH